MNRNAATYFTIGCGRCPKGGTPDCKVLFWPQELSKLRKLVLDSGLTEESKWGVPCYTLDGANVLSLTAFNEYCSINFFKGVLLKDPHNVLVKAGENTQAARQIRFTNVRQVTDLEPILKAYIHEAIALEKSGVKVVVETKPEPIPAELQTKLAADLKFKTAFEALTPGRQRGYIIYFSQPKQTKTRESRIEKCTPKILKGQGMFD